MLRVLRSSHEVCCAWAARTAASSPLPPTSHHHANPARIDPDQVVEVTNIGLDERDDSCARWHTGTRSSSRGSSVLGNRAIRFAVIRLFVAAVPGGAPPPAQAVMSRIAPGNGRGPRGDFADRQIHWEEGCHPALPDDLPADADDVCLARGKVAPMKSVCWLRHGSASGWRRFAQSPSGA